MSSDSSRDTRRDLLTAASAIGLGAFVSETVKVAWPWEFVVADPVEAGAIDELPLPCDRAMTLPAIGRAISPWSSSVTVIVVSPPWGTEVLAAAMYILPATETSVPMPYGALVQWHRRTEVCGPAATSPTMPLDITGYPPCPSGSVVQPTPYLSMVWQVPVAGGPLAIQPPDIQIVEAAVMGSHGS